MAKIKEIISQSQEVTLVTHKAPHHCDEVAATALLHILLEKQGIKYKFLRTFTPAEEGYTDKTPNCIVYDIGLGMYDHHQAPPNDSNCLRHDKDGVVRKYSSVGLIWNEIGELLVPKEYIDEVYENIIKYIDDEDNGFRPNPLSYCIKNLNTESNDSEINHDMAFFKAVDILKTLFRGVFDTIWNKHNDETLIDYIIENSSVSDKYIITPDYYDVAIKKCSEHNCPFYIYPSNRGDNCYVFRTIPPKDGNMYERIVDIPDEVRNWDGVTFLHPNRFMGSAVSKERAIEIVKQILNQESKSKKPLQFDFFKY